MNDSVLSISDLDNLLKKLTYHHGAINADYFDALIEVVDTAQQAYRCVTAIRVDLHYPEKLMGDDMPCLELSLREDIMRRFFKSLDAKLEALAVRKVRDGKRVHSRDFHYFWVREQAQSQHPHYHLLLLFNKDDFYTLGLYNDIDSLAGMIITAWASAWGVKINRKGNGDLFSLFLGSVYFVSEVHHLNINASKPDYRESMMALLLHAGYLAKIATKPVGDGKRNMGSSVRARVQPARF